MSPARHWKLRVLPAINIWPNLLERMLFISGSGFIHSMYFASTRCFHVPELTGSRQNQTATTHRRPCVVPSLSSLQKIIVSRKWYGFTKFSRGDYLKWKSENRIVPDGVNAKLLGNHGVLANRKPGRAFLTSGTKA
ncbi:hypothetical protein POM88_000123 [Heracleum sosnowskyi]|uniref:Uncharacterized protein n=1 Tax=Heracleum sosnowskyi TaxID=360622 RepID=A0AAD8NAK8_9APIA|nr:hypothetical protein POM88_000123 [Heracleum sosnowskyi]